MIAYRGALHDSHWYAVVRTALRAHGFAMSAAEYQSAAREQWRLGCWLRDRALPERLDGAVSLADYQQIAASDPALWHQLPLMAALGFRHTRALGSSSLAPGNVDTPALLGAVFNTGISLVDYIVDETPVGAGLFELLDDDVVHGIFEPGARSGKELIQTSHRAGDARLRLLLGIVAAFGTMAKELLQHSGNHAAWAELKRLIVALFEAERVVSVARRAGAPARDLVPALETKSALPSTALLQVVLLAAPASRQPVDAARRAATLGRLFWRLDDLIDLLADHRQRAPSALLLRLRDRLDAQGRPAASDADLYDVADETAAELTGLLDDLGAGASDDVFDGIDPALDPTAQFARETIAGWARWHDDAGPAPMVSSRVHRHERHAVRHATAMLLGEQRNGYEEAVHHLGFPRQHGGRLAHEIHPALLFQRAVVLDGLLDARAAGVAVPDRVTSAEVMTILRLKHRDVRGGWSYIPEVAELPPDADDLGQVLQVLTRHGGPALAFACEEPIRLALDGAVPDGGFSTWILDSPRRSEAARQTREYLNVVGGAGIHPDVVANLVQGLLEYDAVRYRNVMLRAVAYLESVQDGRGAWPSHWYAGPYYGTYRVASVLAALAPDAAALSRADAFLRDGQRRDGGWGDAETVPLSTALALLAATAMGMDANDAVVERGAACLMSLQQADGGWPASPWIVFQTMDGIESYGSRTITTAFCLKALATRLVRRAPGVTRFGEAPFGARRSHVGAG